MLQMHTPSSRMSSSGAGNSTVDPKTHELPAEAELYQSESQHATFLTSAAMVSRRTDELLFSVQTPLGFAVRVSREHWTSIVTKHPDLADRTEDVKAALAEPDEVRRSKRDENVFLFYRQVAQRRWVVAVAKRDDGVGLLITAYRTDAIKEGTRVWPV